MIDLVLLSEFIKKHTRLLVLGIFLGIGSVVFLPRIITLLPKPNPVSKIAIIGRPTLADIPLFIQNQISSGLTEISTSGEATPLIATSFRIEDELNILMGGGME